MHLEGVEGEVLQGHVATAARGKLRVLQPPLRAKTIVQEGAMEASRKRK